MYDEVCRQSRIARERPAKIQGVHIDRLAVVYVRQSTLQQVEHHQESTRLQYALREYAEQWGWPPQRVIVIDEDQGRSGRHAVGRVGFQHLVAEVGLNHVGLILGRELSRLARSNSAWYQLLDMCALFQTLIADVDGIYDPRNYNDRLVLGLKGTMAEAELHLLKQRMNAGRWAKAHRGALWIPVPTGYIHRLSGEVIKDPDEQVQAVIEVVFRVFEQCGTISGVLRYCLAHAIQLPVRERGGPDKGTLRWVRANRVSISLLLHHPIYAGAYVYGRSRVDPVKQQPGHARSVQVRVPMEEWAVCLQDRFPAYISWAQYEQNLRQMAANAPHSRGVPRNGSSLLAGLVDCGRCGQRMSTQYSNNGGGLRYVCGARQRRYGEADCQSLAGAPVDEVISRLVLGALKPYTLELSLQVADDVEAERARVIEQWQYRLERAQYEVERAFRQYNAVEPEHRLVARQLERQWEEALQTEEQLKREYERVIAHHPLPLSSEERAAIRDLAEDLPCVWHASSTTPAQRQAIVRQLVERVSITVQGDSEQVALEVQWVGGHRSRATAIRPVGRWEQLSFYPALVERVTGLVEEGHRLGRIASILTQEGWHGPHGEGPVSLSMVQRILMREGVQSPRAIQESAGFATGANEWTADDLAQALGMPRASLYNWLHQGKLEARQVAHRGHSRWLIWADETELARLRALHRCSHHGPPRRGEVIARAAPERTTAVG